MVKSFTIHDLPKEERPRERLVKFGEQALSAQVIIAHNHPAGDPSPSQEDSEITKQLVDAGKLLGIKVKDHVIVSKTNFFSFKEHKLI